eukprot:scaffold171237_cov18-Tisochrysis_lutea.AAC.1
MKWDIAKPRVFGEGGNNEGQARDTCTDAAPTTRLLGLNEGKGYMAVPAYTGSLAGARRCLYAVLPGLVDRDVPVLPDSVQPHQRHKRVRPLHEAHVSVPSMIAMAMVTMVNRHVC